MSDDPLLRVASRRPSAVSAWIPSRTSSCKGSDRKPAMMCRVAASTLALSCRTVCSDERATSVKAGLWPVTVRAKPSRSRPANHDVAR